MKVLFTGGQGRLATAIKNIKGNLDIYFASKQECNLDSEDSVKLFANKFKYADIVVAGGIIYPGNIKQYNIHSFLTPINHIKLIESLEQPPKYFINLTTGMRDYDEHVLYRSHKRFCEDLYTRYFRYFMKDTHFINIMPHHVTDPDIRIKSAELIYNAMENIQDYKDNEYVVDIELNSVRQEKW